MRILVISDLYPPHHAGTFDFRCQHLVEALTLRGHTVRVVTSTHGLRGESLEETVERRLLLNGMHGAPAVQNHRELKPLELQNHAALSDSLRRFQPDVVYVFSLRGLSKSLIFGLRHHGIPTVYAVSDFWLSHELGHDPWLQFWNRDRLPFMELSARKALEITGERGRLDSTAPTRLSPGYDRLSLLFDNPNAEYRPPDSIVGFRFERIFFASEFLKKVAVDRGLAVSQAEVLPPGIRTSDFVADLKPQTHQLTRFLAVGAVDESSGFMVAVKALHLLREKLKLNLSLTILGKGDTKYMADLRSLAVRNSLPIEFVTASSPTRDVARIMKGHDAYLHTRIEEEPFAIMPLQAMAAGLPVIGTTLQGLTEILQPGETAFTCEPNDPTELARTIHEILSQPALRCLVCENAQNMVLQKFDETGSLDRIESFLNMSVQHWSESAS